MKDAPIKTKPEIADKKVLDYLERAKVIASKSVLNNIESDDLYEARIIEIAKLIQLEEAK